MWKPSTIAFSALLATSMPTYADEHRQLGPHQHGHGTLNIAVEANTIKMELDVPGDDIVGFEHDPETPEQKATLDKAKATLADPLRLFKIPASSNCSVTDANVAIQEEQHDEAEKEESDDKGPEAHHNAFHVEYALDCKAVADVTAMEFEYFKLFDKAQELDVNVVTSKGQSKFEATRAKPNISLQGLM